jgi:predicted NAD/FAD-dependent oxidoreductase
MKQFSIAVVGAGVAGLACARHLTEAHLDVRLFDKGRSPGGRLATRRAETPPGEVSFDHGAQYISVRDSAFARVIEDFAATGAAALWEFDDGVNAPARTRLQRWVGTPGMSALARHMAGGLAIKTSALVTRVRTEDDGWRLEINSPGQDQSASEGPFDAVVLALPAEQAAPLLAPVAPRLAVEAAAARTSPCWAGLFAFDRRFDAPFDVHRFAADEALAWVARETSKPGRTGPEAWVVHASSAWSSANLDLTPQQAADELFSAFRVVVPEAPQPIWLQAHRWRYAFVETPASSPFAWDPDLRLGLCGDWRIGARVEAAWRSGDSLGAAMQSAFG